MYPGASSCKAVNTRTSSLYWTRPLDQQRHNMLMFTLFFNQSLCLIVLHTDIPPQNKGCPLPGWGSPVVLWSPGTGWSVCSTSLSPGCVSHHSPSSHWLLTRDGRETWTPLHGPQKHSDTPPRHKCNVYPNHLNQTCYFLLVANYRKSLKERNTCHHKDNIHWLWHSCL